MVINDNSVQEINAVIINLQKQIDALKQKVNTTDTDLQEQIDKIDKRLKKLEPEESE